MPIEITLLDGFWIVWNDGTEVARHERQGEAIWFGKQLVAAEADAEAAPRELAHPRPLRLRPRPVRRHVADGRRSGSGAADFRLLAAEDNAINQLVLGALLEQIGVVPTFVENGAEAVTACERAEWDLVLMDIQMPELDGLSATRQVRAAEIASGRRRTTIVAFTANTMSHERAEYKAAGIDAVLAKPVQAAELFKVVEAARLDNGRAEVTPPARIRRQGGWR